MFLIYDADGHLVVNRNEYMWFPSRFAHCQRRKQGRQDGAPLAPSEKSPPARSKAKTSSEVIPTRVSPSAPLAHVTPNHRPPLLFPTSRFLFIPIQPALIATETAVTVDQRPLHERVWEVEREREHKLRLLQAEREKQEGTTFAPPPLGRVSERLARDARPPVAAAAAAAATAAVAATAATAVAAGETRWGAGGKGMSRLKQQSMWARDRRRKRIQEHEEVSAS